jgi:hypothetical protein
VGLPASPEYVTLLGNVDSRDFMLSRAQRLNEVLPRTIRAMAYPELFGAVAGRMTGCFGKKTSTLLRSLIQPS